MTKFIPKRSDCFATVTNITADNEKAGESPLIKHRFTTERAACVKSYHSGTDPFHATCLSHRPLTKNPRFAALHNSFFRTGCSRKHIIYVIVALSVPLPPQHVYSYPSPLDVFDRLI